MTTNAPTEPLALAFTVELDVMGRHAPNTREEARAIVDDFTKLFQEYLTNKEGVFAGDYGVTIAQLEEARRENDFSKLVWGGYEGPYVTDCTVTPGFATESLRNRITSFIADLNSDGLDLANLDSEYLRGQLELASKLLGYADDDVEDHALLKQGVVNEIRANAKMQTADTSPATPISR